MVHPSGGGVAYWDARKKGKKESEASVPTVHFASLPPYRAQIQQPDTKCPGALETWLRERGEMRAGT